MTDATLKCHGDRRREALQMGNRGAPTNGPQHHLSKAERERRANVRARNSTPEARELARQGQLKRWATIRAARPAPEPPAPVEMAPEPIALAAEPLPPEDEDAIDPREYRWIIRDMFRQCPTAWPNDPDPETEAIRREVAAERKAERNNPALAAENAAKHRGEYEAILAAEAERELNNKKGFRSGLAGAA
jgi:hypothetical protein